MKSKARTRLRASFFVHIRFHGFKWIFKIVTSKTNGLRMEFLLP
jgi:hypothetical protein